MVKAPQHYYTIHSRIYLLSAQNKYFTEIWNYRKYCIRFLTFTHRYARNLKSDFVWNIFSEVIFSHRSTHFTTNLTHWRNLEMNASLKKNLRYKGCMLEKQISCHGLHEYGVATLKIEIYICISGSLILMLARDFNKFEIFNWLERNTRDTSTL